MPDPNDFRSEPIVFDPSTPFGDAPATQQEFTEIMYRDFEVLRGVLEDRTKEIQALHADRAALLACVVVPSMSFGFDVRLAWSERDHAHSRDSWFENRDDAEYYALTTAREIALEKGAK